MRVARFTKPYFVPFLFVVGAYLGGMGYFFCGIFLLVIHPCIDLIFGIDPAPNPRATNQEAQSIGYLLCVCLIAPVITALLVGSLWLVRNRDLSLLSILGLGWSLGLTTCSIGITAAHELFHRRKAWQRGIGIWLLAIASYTHFRIEHVHGHHVRVSTPDDPGSAGRNENLYPFWIRSIIGGYLSAWQIENARLKNKSSFLSKVLRHRMVHYTLLQALITYAVYWYAGRWGIFLFFDESISAILLLETINYIEHYGLTRKKLPSGNYEAVTHLHSWDSDHRMTNDFLFNLGRHSEHHRRPLKEYPLLTTNPEAPKHPLGYSAMLLLATVPPLWKRVTHPVLDAMQSKSATASDRSAS